MTALEFWLMSEINKLVVGFLVFVGLQSEIIKQSKGGEKNEFKHNKQNR